MIRGVGNQRRGVRWKGIPKRLFFIWCGDRIAWMRFLSIYSFRKLNPDWETILYRVPTLKEKAIEPGLKQDFMCYDGPDYSDHVSDLGIQIKDIYDPELRHFAPNAAVDILKWKLLASEGGIYSDLDILYIKPISKFYKKIESADSVVCINELGHCLVGFLASSPGNEFFHDVSRMGIREYNKDIYQSAGAYAFNKLIGCKQGVPDCPDEWIDRIADLYPMKATRNLPAHWVYPVKFNETEKLFSEKIFNPPDDCFGVHWFAGVSQSNDFHSSTDHRNFTEKDLAITKLISAVIGDDPLRNLS